MAHSKLDVGEDLDVMVVCERSMHTIRENLANGGCILHLRQCLDLSLKLLKTIQNIRELMSHWGLGSGGALFGAALVCLHRCLKKAEVLVSQCGQENWVIAAFSLDENNFREILLDVALCYKVICAQAKRTIEEWNDLWQSESTFLPTPDKDILKDQQELRDRLEGFVNEFGNVGHFGYVISQVSIAKYLLQGMKSKQSEADTSEICKQKIQTEFSGILGSGAAAAAHVYRATWLGTNFAVKTFPGQASESSFQEEARILAKLGHPHVVRLLWSSVNGRERGDPSIVMLECMDKDLSSITNDREDAGPFSLHEVCHIMLQIAEGVCSLHNRPILHRDLKPGNVLFNLNSDLSNSQCHVYVKLVDFGALKSGKGKRWSRLNGSVSNMKESAIPEDVGHMTSGREGVHDFLPENTEAVILELDSWQKMSQMVRSIPNDNEPARKRVRVPRNQSENNNSISSILRMEYNSLFAEAMQTSLSDVPHLLPQKENDFDSGAGKKIRTRHWSAEEIRAVLELRQEATRVDNGRYIWDYVSENLFKRYGFDRASYSCQQQWEALLKSFNAIREHESKIQSGATSSISFWEMDEDERSKNKLLQAFDLEWYEMIESILAEKPFDKDLTSSIHTMGADLPSSDLPLCQSQLNAGHSGSADCGDDEFVDSEFDDSDTQSEDEEGSGDSTATIESQARVPVGSHVPQMKQSYVPEFETNSNSAGRKRSAAEAMEDSLVSVIVPFVSKQIEDALKPLLAVLKSREEELNHPKKLARRAGESGSKTEEMQSTPRVEQI